MVRDGADVGVVRVLDRAEPTGSGELTTLGDLVADDPASIERAVRALNSRDIVFIQHEYGLFGGRDGDDVLKVLDGLRVPVIAILHTVLPTPTDHQREVLNAVVRRVDAAVVMTDRAESILRRVNVVGATPVAVIPHGAAVSTASTPSAPGARPLLLDLGLIGPGKGIQHVIDALGELRDLDPAPLYVIAGQTHPKVLAYEGDVYRQSLIRRVEHKGLGKMVHFDNSYRNLSSLGELIGEADVVILPYDSREQATSGVLVDAVAAGRPVIATAFPHAVELLSSGAGIVVPHEDPHALAEAIRRVVTDRELEAEMTAEAMRIAPSLSWDAVARQYRGLAALVLERVGAVA